MNNYTMYTTTMEFEFETGYKLERFLHKAFLLSNDIKELIVHEVAPRENISQLDKFE